MTHFFRRLPVHFVFFPLVHFRAFTEQRSEKEWEFSFRISFSIKVPRLPGGKAVQLLCNPPPNTEAKWQREERVRRSERREERQGGMKGVQEGRSLRVSGTIWPSEWLSFVRIWRAWVGGKEGASVSNHTLTSQTRPLCRHTPPHSSLNRARQ